MLPFDSDDNKETARQTIYDPVPFDHAVWGFASKDVKDIISSNINIVLKNYNYLIIKTYRIA